MIAARRTASCSTNGDGLVRYHNGRFNRYSERDGLFNDTIFQILEDGGGNLWTSSNRGISAVDPHELEVLADPNDTAQIAVYLKAGRNEGLDLNAWDRARHHVFGNVLLTRVAAMDSGCATN